MEDIKKLKLLIVDDDRDLLRQLEFLLEDDFKEVLTASSKEQALESVSAHGDVDVFLVDVRLSETDPGNREGLELVKEIRRQNSNAVILMMSRYTAAKYEELVRQEAQADGFIRKPFTMDEFIELAAGIKREEQC
ncbi:MAG: response regulator [Candidatus Aminicenantes bacterium]|nr:response regulator [Candidatus Aminicenantes bacterium]